MKKIILLIAGLGILITLGVVSVKLISNKGKSDEAIADFNFEIKDTAHVDRIVVTEPNGVAMDLIREGKSWRAKDGHCIQQHLVQSILDAAFNIRFKGYIPENTIPTAVNRMATQGTKVEFFVDGDWFKTWYVGSSTPDHYGTYMLVESEENGKSDLPVIMEIKGVKGIIGPRFFADARRWACTEIFSLEMSQIASVKVNFTERKERNFAVEKVGQRYLVSSNGKPFPAVDTNMVFRYLHNYKKIHFDVPNYDFMKRQIDSLKKSSPFCTLTVKTTRGITTRLPMYRCKSANGEETVDDFGEKVTYDVNRFWCFLPNGQLVKCQYFVFNPLIMGHIYFNYKSSPTLPSIANR